jgi:putative SbcD/Mre11-related phosphoesterase
MKLEPIPGEPALLLKSKMNVLILADLHIGIESELRQAGINIPSQTEKMAEHMLELCQAHTIDEVIIAGDVKHNVPLTSRQEHYEIPLVFERLKDVVEEVHVTPGNHDGNLRFHLPQWVNIHGAKGFVHEKLGFFHGHTWPAKEVMKCKTVIMAHEHPHIQFIETLGERDSRPCWVRAQFISEKTDERYPGSYPEIIIMPTFNGLCGGNALNDPSEKYLSPVVKNGLVDIDCAGLYLLDGTNLGKLKDLRVKYEQDDAL